MTEYFKKTGYFRAVLLIGMFTLLIPSILAQDIHFSQYNSTPVLTNPATTGMFNENVRFANNYRNQWGKIGVPFRTLYTSLDTKFFIRGKWFGIGALLVHDQSSAYNLKADELLISLSYTKFIKNQQFAIGIQPGYAFKAFNLNDVSFGDQFDPFTNLFNTHLPSDEKYLNNNLQYFDLNMGIYWRTLIRNIIPSAGISLSHILNPKVTFSSSGKEVRLPVKLTLHSQVLIPVNSKVDVTPGFLYSTIPGTNELLMGCTESYAIGNFFIPVKKIYALNFFRINPFRNIDALILGGGIKFSKFDLGLSYDINISPLAQHSFFNGAFEISFIYTGGNRQQKNVNEPCYIY